MMQRRSNHQSSSRESRYFHNDDSDSGSSTLANWSGKTGHNSRRRKEPDYNRPERILVRKKSWDDMDAAERRLRAERNDLKEDKKNLEAENARLKAELADTERNRDFWMDGYTARVPAIDLQQSNRDKYLAEQEAAGYKKQLDEQLPLVEIGERASREINLTKKELSRVMMRLIAGMEWLMPAALARLTGKGVDIEAYTFLYEQIYRCPDLASFQTWPTKIRQIIDLGASVKAGEGIHGGLGTEYQRDTVMDYVDRIITRYLSLMPTTLEGTEEDAEIESYLAEAEAIKNAVVRTYNHRRGYRRVARNAQPSATVEEPAAINDHGRLLDCFIGAINAIPALGWEPSSGEMSNATPAPLQDAGLNHSVMNDDTQAALQTGERDSAPPAPIDILNLSADEMGYGSPAPPQDAEDGWEIVTRRRRGG